ncbi:coiled-coil domain-containing protein lost boys [Lycorma delicatula]|uniref:coiled-coil domain-containing protein lost boys n=1 Tax=Lycorma delicatula TaxID=130591 RepID=UPI003F51061B
MSGTAQIKIRNCASICLSGLKNYPESYKRNTSKEKLLLLYAENFRRQFTTKYKQRKPLYLAVENECGLQKFVSTTIIPTKLTYPEFYTWEGCASFVSDHITYELLPDDKPTFYPDRLVSPDTVMKTQRGNCFEISILLASLLIGSGYNAYVVAGYATQEKCVNDLTRSNCTLIEEKPPEEPPPPEIPVSKYIARPVRDLNSKFELMMEEREQAQIREEEERSAEEERLRISELEKPEPDPLYGWRIHSWVLMLPGKRDITEPFFIEPPSGLAFPLSNPNYLGIESIWNHDNYWVNVQTCENGCQDLNTDINNTDYWEHLLAGEPWDQRVIAKDTFNLPDEKDILLQEKHLDMPSSWVLPINLPHKKYEERYPKGNKVVNYRKTRCEFYAPYLHKDGLVWHALTYKHYDFLEPESVTESFMNREDYLVKSFRKIGEDYIEEHYKRGRDDAMKEFKQSSVNSQILRVIEFYSEARVDGLKKFEMGPTHIFELFQDREDRLVSRYCKTDDRFEKQEASPRYSVLYVVEKYKRNPDIPADEDVASREFFIQTNEIILKYHYADDKITAAMRRFTKPPMLQLGDRLTYNSDLFTIYKPDSLATPDSKVYLFSLMVENLKFEEDTLQHIRYMEDEMFHMIQSRNIKQVQGGHLIISIFDEERNEEAKEGMREMERELKERSYREVEADVDFLAPYFIMYRNAKITANIISAIKERCLNDFKESAVNKANKIQKLFEQTVERLTEKQKYIESIGEKMTREMEEELVTRIKEILFLMNTLELRLERHKAMASIRYKALEEYLSQDPRLEVSLDAKEQQCKSSIIRQQSQIITN